MQGAVEVVDIKENFWLPPTFDGSFNAFYGEITLKKSRFMYPNSLCQTLYTNDKCRYVEISWN